jgi:hypothetical protein
MKREVKKLKVNRETLRHLTEAELKEAAGGIGTLITLKVPSWLGLCEAAN